MSGSSRCFHANPLPSVGSLAEAHPRSAPRRATSDNSRQLSQHSPRAKLRFTPRTESQNSCARPFLVRRVGTPVDPAPSPEPGDTGGSDGGRWVDWVSSWRPPCPHTLLAGNGHYGIPCSLSRMFFGN